MNQSEQQINISNKSTKPVISIVLSFKNEEQVLPELISRLRNVLDVEYKNNYELIFVNDNSTDTSEEILINAAEDRNDIKIITMSRTFGVSECALAGLEYSSGDAVIYMDADLQDPPEVIPELIGSWKSGDNVDVVNTMRQSRDGESRIKLGLTRIAYNILKYVSNIELQVEVGDFKLLSRRAVNYLIRFREKKPFLRGLVSWIGFNQITITYKREARFAGKTKFPVYGYKVIHNFMNSALISFSDLPLQFAFFIGMIISFCAFFALIYIIVQKFLIQVTSGWTAIMAAILFLGGLQLMTIGIMGLYISSIYLETKGRPNYIIKNTFGFDDTIDISSKKNEVECPYRCRYQNTENISAIERDSDGIKNLK